MGSREGAERTAARKVGVSLDEYQERRAAGLKWCFRCRSWKLREQFAIDRSRTDGLTAQCFDCRRVGQRKKLLSSGTPAERQGAHDAVRWAIKRGRLIPPTDLPCLDCGGKAVHYHHHLGYERSHWLDVVAVCYRCHRRRHWA